MPLTPEQFRAKLESQIAGGESQSALGRALGVSHAAVKWWLSGGKASNTVLILAGLLWGSEWP